METLAYLWNGSAWQALSVPGSIPSTAMEHIQAFSPTDAWAVGTAPNASGTGSVVAAVDWNGSTWTQVATPFSTTVNLTVNAISGDSASDIWVVGETATRGYTGGQRTSVILHYNGSAWAQVTAPDQSGLLDVDACLADRRLGSRGRRLGAEVERLGLDGGDTARAVQHRRDRRAVAD